VAIADGAPSVEPSAARKWSTLLVVLMCTVIVVLDNTILNVAIPTILRDFHTTLPSLQWVITGYSLTFATCLIIGGRLGDLYGHRRVLIVGAALFCAGSLLASESWNVGSLIVGEAIIEGIGASLMLPATLAVLSTTFEGRQRATAFAAWGAIVGSAAALGPVLGGFLTTNYSWRWSFRINVIVAPLAIIGTLLVVARDRTARRREELDLPGAACIALGMFLLVFGLSEGGTYGWLRALRAFHIAGVEVWPAGAPVSVIPVVFALAGGVLFAFYVLERRRGRADRGPLFDFALLQHRTFRYGLLTTTVVAMGQLGMMFALALFLQEGKHLSAMDNGLWMLPLGGSMLVAAPFAGRLVHRVGVTAVVRAGLLTQAAGMGYLATAFSVHAGFWRLLPGLVAYGIGAGCASSQLTNVVLGEIPMDKSGVASGTNSTVRQVGNSLGIAVIGAVVTAQRSIVRGTSHALMFTTAVVLIGSFVSLLIPKMATDAARVDRPTLADDLIELAQVEAEGELLAPGTV
jgi:EmrB/QacA subfamily drug resistance transporter